MIKRLITWLYERYGKEPEYTTTLENRKRYMQAKSIENEFRGAGYTGKPKPDYPKVNGKEPSDSVKKYLDQIYDGGKLVATKFGTFSNIPPKGNALPLKPTQIYEDTGIWERVYKEELAKPQWTCEDSEYGKRRNELRARQAADIAVGNVVWIIK